MNRRTFVLQLAGAASAGELLARLPTASASSLRTESLEETRRLMWISIRTDPDVALDTAIFVDQWRRELGRIINLGTVSPFARGAGVVDRERPPPVALEETAGSG